MDDSGIVPQIRFDRAKFELSISNCIQSASENALAGLKPGPSFA
jgi:hypothetical protein